MPALLERHDYVKITEAAALLRVSPSTVRRMIRSGDLLGLRVGGSVRIPSESLAALLQPVRTEEREP